MATPTQHTRWCETMWPIRGEAGRRRVPRRVDCAPFPSTSRSGGASFRKCRSNCCKADLGRANEILAGAGSGGAWRWPGGARLFRSCCCSFHNLLRSVGPNQIRPFGFELRTEYIDGDPAFGQLPVGQAIKRLYDAGYRDIAFALCTDIAANLTDARQLHSLAHLAADNGDARTVLTVGKIAIQRGYPLDIHAFPLQGVPINARVDSPVDVAMVYAIARQESAFAPHAQSSAGAQGLMQLMPDTARRTARRLGLEFDLQRLLDPEYSTQLGAAHLRDLMEDWRVSSSSFSLLTMPAGAMYRSGSRLMAIRAPQQLTRLTGWSASRSRKHEITFSA